MVIFKENLKSIFNPKKYKHFKYGSKLGNKYLSHLRLGRSFLNSHRFVTGLSDSDRCSKCNKNKIDDNVHFVLNCERYIPHRIILFNKIESLLPGFKVKSKKNQLFILLNGIYLDSEFQDCRNKHIMFAMQEFILNTKRFEKPS